MMKVSQLPYQRVRLEEVQRVMDDVIERIKACLLYTSDAADE